MKYSLIVSTTCKMCGKRGKKCVELEDRIHLCPDCLRGLADTLDLIQRRITTTKDLDNTPS